MKTQSYPPAKLAAALGIALILLLPGCAPRITSPTTASGQQGQPFDYQITASRRPTVFSADVPPPAGLSVDTTTGRISGSPTEAGRFPIQISARNGRGEGSATLALRVDPSPNPGPGPGPDPAPVPGTHAVVSGKELFIIDSAVISDRRAQPGGAWHFREALRRIAGVTTDADLEAFAQAWFSTWTSNTGVAGTPDTFSTRPWVTAALRQAWQGNRIRLIGIVNRIDLTRFQQGNPALLPESLGEGRFIYEVTDAGGQSLPFTLIFEYRLPSIAPNLQASLTQWARRWHALGRAELGGPTQFPEAYLAELQTLTDAYSAHGNLAQLRSNEFLPPTQGQRLWELREFHFVAGPARLEQVTVVGTPAIEANGGPDFRNFITANAGAIVNGAAPPFSPSLQGAVSPVRDPGFTWNGGGAPARPTFITSFNTCSGCHAGDTGTLFQHLGVNAPQMSAFLRGEIPIADSLPPVGNTRRTHNEMEDRRRILAAFAGDVPVTTFGLTRGTSGVVDILRARAGRPH